jgi:dihydropteroate synthase
VARQALEAGAHIINDITALQGDPNLAEVVRTFQAGVVLMHMQGTPATMQLNPAYQDVVAEVTGFLEARLQATTDLGIARTQVVLDPGIGFGKSSEHNLRLLARLAQLGNLGRPVCLGVSRKGFLGRRLNRPVGDRLAGSLAVACHAMAHGGAQIFRVHDVAATHDAVVVFAALSAIP